jgi:hypothetical protein
LTKILATCTAISPIKARSEGGSTPGFWANGGGDDAYGIQFNVNCLHHWLQLYVFVNHGVPVDIGWELYTAGASYQNDDVLGIPPIDFTKPNVECVFSFTRVVGGVQAGASIIADGKIVFDKTDFKLIPLSDDEDMYAGTTDPGIGEDNGATAIVSQGDFIIDMQAETQSGALIRSDDIQAQGFTNPKGVWLVSTGEQTNLIRGPWPLDNGQFMGHVMYEMRAPGQAAP